MSCTQGLNGSFDKNAPPGRPRVTREFAPIRSAGRRCGSLVQKQVAATRLATPALDRCRPATTRQTGLPARSGALRDLATIVTPDTLHRIRRRTPTPMLNASSVRSKRSASIGRFRSARGICAGPSSSSSFIIITSGTIKA